MPQGLNFLQVCAKSKATFIPGEPMRHQDSNSPPEGQPFEKAMISSQLSAKGDCFVSNFILILSFETQNQTKFYTLQREHRCSTKPLKITMSSQGLRFHRVLAFQSAFCCNNRTPNDWVIHEEVQFGGSEGWFNIMDWHGGRDFSRVMTRQKASYRDSSEIMFKRESERASKQSLW